jgi:hypothetical protein
MAEFSESNMVISTIRDKLCFFEKGILDSMVSGQDAELKAILELNGDESSGGDHTELVLNLILQRSTEVASRDWSAIFAGMSAQEAKLMAKQGRELLSDSVSDVRSLTYGEVTISYS